MVHPAGPCILRSFVTKPNTALFKKWDLTVKMILTAFQSWWAARSLQGPKRWPQRRCITLQLLCLRGRHELTAVFVSIKSFQQIYNFPTMLGSWWRTQWPGWQSRWQSAVTTVVTNVNVTKLPGRNLSCWRKLTQWVRNECECSCQIIGVSKKIYLGVQF